ncbi:MAG: hypothetical protein AAF489_01595 [Bacteroidota bacterium]
MKVMLLQLFWNEHLFPKKKLLLLFLLFGPFKFNAQETHDLNLRIIPGLLLLSDSDNLGLMLNAEPHFKISERSSIGLRFGVALNSHKFEQNKNAQFIIDRNSDGAVVSFVPSYDYYFTKDKVKPYLGLGLGYYLISYVAIANPTKEVSEGSVNNQIGMLLRGGFDLGKTRFGIEYNFIPKADIEIPNDQPIGVVKSSYFGLSVGLNFGVR